MTKQIKMVHNLLAYLLLTLTSLVGCTSNQFRHEYRGDLYKPVEFAAVVPSPPTDAILIGRSDFETNLVPRVNWNTGLGTLGDSHAIAVAKSIGANYVTWETTFRTETAIISPMDTSTFLQAVYGIYFYESSFYRSKELMLDEFGQSVGPIGKTQRNKKTSRYEWIYFD